MRNLICICLLFSLFRSYGQECTFDLSTQTDEFLKAVPEFSNYTWDDEIKQGRVVLTNNETLTVTRGGCHHFSISAKLNTGSKLPFEKLDPWFEKSLWVAQRIFSKGDYEWLKKRIDKKEYVHSQGQDMTSILFTHPNYSEFMISMRKRGSNTELYIGYYYR